jgi:hypothetical protein
MQISAPLCNLSTSQTQLLCSSAAPASDFAMPYLDFEWPLDKLGVEDELFEEGGLEPYVTELLQEVSVKLRSCLEQRIMSCLSRGCTCPLRLQIKVGCWNLDCQSQDSDPESDHPDDVQWEALGPCKIIELRARLGGEMDVSGDSSDEASDPFGIENTHTVRIQPGEPVQPALDDSMVNALEASLFETAPARGASAAPSGGFFSDVMSGLQDE